MVFLVLGGFFGEVSFWIISEGSMKGDFGNFMVGRLRNKSVLDFEVVLYLFYLLFALELY